MKRNSPKRATIEIDVAWVRRLLNDLARINDHMPIAYHEALDGVRKEIDRKVGRIKKRKGTR